MSRCENCGYFYKDVDRCGEPVSRDYCHFEGPDGWAPCEQDENDSDWEEMEQI